MVAAVTLAAGPWLGSRATATSVPGDPPPTTVAGSETPPPDSVEPPTSTEPPVSTEPATTEPDATTVAPDATEPADTTMPPPTSGPVGTTTPVTTAPVDTAAPETVPETDDLVIAADVFLMAAVPVSCRVMNPVRPGSSLGVRCLETALRANGYIGFTPDDTFSSATVTAVRAFQADNALTTSGVGDFATLDALGIRAPAPSTICWVSVPVRGGSTQGVLCVEARLRQLGYTGQTPDHSFTAASITALSKLQHSYGLPPTGVADRDTLAVMGIWRSPPAASCSVRFPVRPGSAAGARCVEGRLRQLGFTSQQPDDSFNPTSVAALRQLQHSFGLAVSGVAHPSTLSAMGVWSAPPAPTCRLSFSVRSGSVVGARCVETRLVQLGLTGQAPDDSFNSTSVNALRAAQYAYGLAADGIAGPNTLAALGLWNAPPPPGCVVSVAVRSGSTAGVACVETRLRQLGLTGQAPDNVYNSTTATAVRHFQYSVGLPTTGTAGKSTLQALGVWRDPPNPYPVPANSGTGRRIVYSRAQQRIWAVNADGSFAKTHRVSGRTYEPYSGTYYVYSRSLNTYSANDPSVRWRYMVRFTYGPNGGRIGFHEIPNRNGVPLQSREQVGLPLSSGCVRQATPDARWIWDWAPIGTKVVVL